MRGDTKWILSKLRDDAKAANKTIVLARGEDERVIKARLYCCRRKLQT